jgi:hypothetical protein
MNDTFDVTIFKDAGEWWAKHLPMIEREGEKK